MTALSEKFFETHVIALARNLGICPKHRMPKEDELVLTREWMRLRRREAHEVHEKSLKRFIPPANG